MNKPKEMPIPTMNNKMHDSVTRCVKIIPPNSAIGVLSSGVVMQWMDEVAFITATRFSQMAVTMKSCAHINLHTTIQPNTIIELTGEIADIVNTELTVRVELYTEGMYDGVRQQAGFGSFLFTSNQGWDITMNAQKEVNRLPANYCFVGGESELRRALNERLSPKTIARSTLYKYLVNLKLRKTLYTTTDLGQIVQYMSSLNRSRKKPIRNDATGVPSE